MMAEGKQLSKQFLSWVYHRSSCPPGLYENLARTGVLSRGELVESEEGCELAARVAVRRQGIACSLGGGDVSQAALALLRENKVRKVLVADLDLHHGQENAVALSGEDRAVTFSMHCRSSPLRIAASTCDVWVGDVGDKDYLDVLERHLVRLLDEHRPDLVLYDAGVGVSERDESREMCRSGMRLSDKGIRRRDAFVLAECFLKRSIPVATVLGSAGRGDDLAHRHSIHASTAADVVLAAASPAASRQHLLENKQGEADISDLLQPWAIKKVDRVPPPPCADLLEQPPIQMQFPLRQKRRGAPLSAAVQSSSS